MTDNPMRLWVIRLALPKHSESERKFTLARRIVMSPSAEEAADMAQQDLMAGFHGSYYGAPTHWAAQEIPCGIRWLTDDGKVFAEDRDDTMTPFPSYGVETR